MPGAGVLLHALTALVVALTLGLMIARPRGLSESWFAAGGAVVMIATGVVDLADVHAVLTQTGDVLLFLFGMMVVTALAEQAGVFAWLADGCARLAGGSVRLLFCLVFLLGAAVTALLSLDVTILMLTPIVYALAVRRRLDALPFMFACTFVANTASLLFPMSNLTNLLVFSQLHLGFGAFIATMWLPNLVAVAVNLGIFLWLFRDRLPARYDQAPAPDEPRGWWFMVALGVLAATLAALFGLGLIGRPLAWGALGGAALLLGIGLAGRRVGLRGTASDISWPLIVFVVGMFLVVRGFSDVWLAGLGAVEPSGTGRAIFGGVAAGLVSSNVVSNVPTIVFALPLLDRLHGPLREAAAYGMLLGTNIGPTLTTYGSLATMLWLTLVRKRGLAVSGLDYLKISAVTMPPVLLAATVALWLVLR